MFYFARCINIIFNSLLAQLVKSDAHTTRKMKFIHAIFITYYYHIVLYKSSVNFSVRLRHQQTMTLM